MEFLGSMNTTHSSYSVIRISQWCKLDHPLVWPREPVRAAWSMLTLSTRFLMLEPITSSICREARTSWERSSTGLHPIFTFGFEAVHSYSSGKRLPQASMYCHKRSPSGVHTCTKYPVCIHTPVPLLTVPRSSELPHSTARSLLYTITERSVV